MSGEMNQLSLINDFEENIKLEKKFAKVAKCILGMYFIGQDPIMDKEQGTDFLTFTVKPFKVGFRLRRYESDDGKIQYFKNYNNQFTIRWELFSKGRTEIHKIRDGLVDYILYGFLDKEKKNIIQYFIGDLNVFRENEGRLQPEIKQNKGNHPTKLAAYCIDWFPSNFILKKYP